MRRWVVAALVVAPGVAFAQAPGDIAPQPPPPAPAPPALTWPQHWSVSLGIQPGALTPKEAGEHFKSLAYSGVEASIRYRIPTSIDVGLVLFAGGSDEGDIGVGGFLVEGRYLFRPQRHWNPFVSMALGAVAISPNDATKEQKQGRGAFRFGGGVEYRWSWIAVDASLHLLAVARNEDAIGDTAGNEGLALSHDSVTGAQFTLGATAHF